MKAFNFYSVLIFILTGSLSATAQLGTWKVLKTKNNIPGRSECGMAAVNGKLYLIGGDSGAPQPVESFDPKTLIWTKLALSPVTMHHLQAVAYKNKIYVLDAFSQGGFPNQEPMANVYVYDTEKNSWKAGGEIPAVRKRAGAGAAEYNGKLYLVDGIQHGHSSGTTNMFDMYDPVTEKWTQLPDAPHIRDHCSATIVKDKLYVLGGRNTSFRDPENKINFFSQTNLFVDCYDFKTGKWSTLSAKLPLGSGGGGAVTLNNIIYYIGGERATERESNAPRKNVFYLDPSSQNDWKAADSLHFARNGMAAAVMNDKIYVAGGSGGGPGGPPPPGNFHPGNMPPAFDSTHNQFPKNPPPNTMHQGGEHDQLKIEVFNLK